jgi:hypothetical protein
MAAVIHTAAGTKFSISAGVPATFDGAGYLALTYTEVKEVTNIPDFGPTTNVVSYNPLSDVITKKLKGSVNTGSGSLEFAALSTDAGQALVKTASAYNAPAYSVKIEEQDGAISYYRAIFTSYSKKIGTIDNVVMISSNLELTTVVIDVAAP